MEVALTSVGRATATGDVGDVNVGDVGDVSVGKGNGELWPVLALDDGIGLGGEGATLGGEAAGVAGALGGVTTAVGVVSAILLDSEGERNIALVVG